MNRGEKVAMLIITDSNYTTVRLSRMDNYILHMYWKLDDAEKDLAIFLLLPGGSTASAKLQAHLLPLLSMNREASKRQLRMASLLYIYF